MDAELIPGVNITSLRAPSLDETDTHEAREERIALYARRAEQGRDIFTGQKRGSFAFAPNDDNEE